MRKIVFILLLCGYSLCEAKSNSCLSCKSVNNFVHEVLSTGAFLRAAGHLTKNEKQFGCFEIGYGYSSAWALNYLHDQTDRDLASADGETDQIISKFKECNGDINTLKRWCNPNSEAMSPSEKSQLTSISNAQAAEMAKRVDRCFNRALFERTSSPQSKPAIR